MKSLTIYSNAKINIHLDILKKLKTGYHELYMINQNISLYDTINLKKSDNLKFSSNIESLNNKNNIIFKSIELVERLSGQKIPVSIELKKRIPLQAGLGGGSSNAAAIIMGILKLYDIEINLENLLDVSSKIGADVPFFLKGGTSMVRGIGEKIYPIPSDKFYYIIIKPDFSIDTKKAYEDYDKEYKNIRKDYAFKNIRLTKDFIIKNCFNSFDRLYEKKYNLAKYKNDLLNNGAFFVQLTGSGSAIFGMFESELAQEKAYENLINKYDEIYVCNTQTSGSSIKY